jgi:hypothetical protein
MYEFQNTTIKEFKLGKLRQFFGRAEAGRV